MELADATRLLCAIEATVLVLLCITCMLGAAMDRDQRVRYAALGLIGFVVVAGQIDAWGKPGNWRMPVLAVALGLAIYGSVAFLARRRADRE
jgi:hypothetical protein